LCDLLTLLIVAVAAIRFSYAASSVLALQIEAAAGGSDFLQFVRGPAGRAAVEQSGFSVLQACAKP
jgi:ABC-type molybdate transport system substrate-binding protein